MNKTIRLDKYLANFGYASRRGVSDFLAKNKVEIDGQRVKEPGERFDPNSQTLKVNGKQISSEEKVYYLINKPKGYVSSATDEDRHPSVLKLLKNVKERVYPVGRLDVDTSGLLLLTNDGELTYRLTHPKFKIPKTYQATIQGRINHKQLTLLKSGVRLKDGKTAPAQVKIHAKSETSTKLLITLHEGRNRQIRRMCKAINLHLLELKRVEFAGIKLTDQKLGEYRELSTEELELLHQ